MLLFPPGGACSLTDDFSVVGPQLFPVAILCPNVSSSLELRGLEFYCSKCHPYPFVSCLLNLSSFTWLC